MCPEFDRASFRLGAYRCRFDSTAIVCRAPHELSWVIRIHAGRTTQKKPHSFGARLFRGKPGEAALPLRAQTFLSCQQRRRRLLTAG